MTWDIWDTGYNSDNWKTEFIFVAWQLRVTLDSIRNSCDGFDWLMTGGAAETADSADASADADGGNVHAVDAIDATYFDAIFDADADENEVDGMG